MNLFKLFLIILYNCHILDTSSTVQTSIGYRSTALHINKDWWCIENYTNKYAPQINCSTHQQILLKSLHREKKRKTFFFYLRRRNKATVVHLFYPKLNINRHNYCLTVHEFFNTLLFLGDTFRTTLLQYTSIWEHTDKNTMKFLDIFLDNITV
jgi:hypothetical protein